MSEPPEFPGTHPVLHAQLEAQVGYLSSLSRHGVELLARVSELNLQLAREALDDALTTGQQLAACSDPLQLGAVAMRGMQPAGEHLRNYQHGMMAALVDAQAGLGQGPPLAVKDTSGAGTRRRN